MEIVLHQWEISPYCGKVRRILRHKRLAFQTCDYNGLRALRVRRLTPPGKLPVLDYGGTRIADSSRIAAFIEQRHPDYPLLPADPAQRATALMWEDWADESLFWFEVYFRVHDAAALQASAASICAGRPPWERYLIVPLLRLDYRARLRAQGLGRLTEAEVDRLFTQHLDSLDALLAHSPRLVGDHTTIADIAVAAMLDEIIRTSHRRAAIHARPHLCNWLAAMSA
ncbi:MULTISPECIES: glutathione S-transferase family protein [unclassified Duganella]|uniref:glutathione S-transferase family protein n=1 Tax=unclassified Duganella TaxID=2636909 RepID=UPI000E345781|nr:MULTISPECIES: glutathione S-transferase family protein [unclassified Duganella]RFP13645.1 glutathione S-transferase family protein [Duganella sp. BJB475]RFP36353.1 glutathione S-transferase family protein [Duganella sp. BJB476]